MKDMSKSHHRKLNYHLCIPYISQSSKRWLNQSNMTSAKPISICATLAFWIWYLKAPYLNTTLSFFFCWNTPPSSSVCTALEKQDLKWGWKSSTLISSFCPQRYLGWREVFYLPLSGFLNLLTGIFSGSIIKGS